MVNNYRDASEVPRKRKIRWTLIVVVLFFLGLLVDYFFFHFLFNEKYLPARAVMQTIPAPPALDSALGETSEAAGAKRSTEAPAAQIQKFQTELSKCFGSEGALSQSSSTDDVIQQLVRVNPVSQSSLEVENIHIRLKDGSLRRMHLIQADASNGTSVKELRYFSVDKEGMPVLIPLPDDKRINPSAAYLASLQNEGTVVFHQLKEKRVLKDGSELSVNIINNHVFEFQLFGKEKSLSCRELECICR